MRQQYPSLLRWWLIVALVLSSTVTRAEEPGTDELQKLVVPTDQPSSLVTAAQDRLTALSSRIKPQFKAAPQSLVDDDSNLALYGDLFRTGGCFALFEISIIPDSGANYTDGAVGLAEWGGSKWELRGLWKIASVWRPKGWEKKHDPSDYLPTTPATQPFALRDFSGDGIPEVTIAGEVDKYFQAHYFLRFDPKGHTLNLLAYAMAKPELVGNYVRLYSKSGRRAIYEEWEYLLWSGDRLVSKATWHDESPYNTEESPFIRAEIPAKDGRVETLVIQNEASDVENETVYSVTKGDAPFGVVVFRWQKPIDTSGEIATAWLFEKITGLPRDLLPRRDGVKKPARLETCATVRVTGTDEALRRLRP